MPRPQCPRCTRPTERCLCALIPCLASGTRVLILQHPSEVRHALNTARLAALGLSNAELRVGEVFESLAALLQQPGYRACLLFPGEQAQGLMAFAEQHSELPLLLVVPDGTWRKARKLLHLNPLLAALPRVVLPAGLQSRYRLRKAPMPGALSTIEAIVTALNTVEAPACFDALLKPFEVLIEGQIDAMGEQTFQRNHGKPNAIS
ncbi:MAG: DTW domain-containing protein [Pseudomonas sp.]|uniref:tRNA-uridine aminocarboxypropyltransferase n=1 Tax=Pseudomonas sp. TaxID=306 RepID=UPI0027276FFE|nr:DTW domain-containing protein [Pseudomonas sp.]MDO9618196.1 DTW domain-containing protein [Pseudomonas sp.]MDP2445030.1 DTW domain-containing protein [Pseudomonas sp.]MDZ4333315.1 DTW domain-containing protein [Pseudomonas sp.]